MAWVPSTKARARSDSRWLRLRAWSRSKANAWLTSMPSRSASLPLACSMMTRLFKRLADVDAVGVESAGRAAEEVERPDDLVTQPHRQGLHGGEAGLPGSVGELGPALVSAQVGG
jgi:hypothetical protein